MSLALLVGAAAGGTAAPLAAVDATDPAFAAFAGDLDVLVPESQRAALAGATEADGAGDLFHPSGESPGIAPPEADIGLVASFDVEMTAAVAAAAGGPGGILNCDAGGTVCSSMRAGQSASLSFRAYAAAMRAPVAPRAGVRLELGVAMFDSSPRDGRPAEAWEAIPEFRGDFFHGSNLAWTLLSENGEPFRLMRLEYGPGDAGFLAANTDAVAIVRGSTWTILVPKAEWDGTVTSRHYAFRAGDESFDPATSAVDTHPDIFDPPKQSAPGPTIALDATTASGRDTGWLVGATVAAVALVVGGAALAAAIHRRRRHRIRL